METLRVSTAWYHVNLFFIDPEAGKKSSGVMAYCNNAPRGSEVTPYRRRTEIMQYFPAVDTNKIRLAKQPAGRIGKGGEIRPVCYVNRIETFCFKFLEEERAELHLAVTADNLERKHGIKFFVTFLRTREEHDLLTHFAKV
jgi:hypothetical protein